MFFYTGVVIYLIFFYLMNVIVPFYGDDIAFSFSYGKKIRTLAQVLEEVYHEYFVLHGRLICNFFSHFVVVILNDTLFNLINTIVFVITLVLSCYFVSAKEKLSSLLISCLLLGYFLINTHDLFFWAVGSANYLWALPFTLVLFILIKKITEENKTTNPSVAFFLGFAFSFTHEAFAISLSGALLFMLVYYRKKKNKILLYVSCGVFLSTLIQFLSPGILNRFLLKSDQSGFDFVSFIKRFVAVAYGLRITYVTILIIMLSLIKKKSLLEFCKSNLFLIVFSVLGILPGILAGDGGRAIFVAEWGSVLFVSKFVDFAVNKHRCFLSICILLVIFSMQIYVYEKSSFNWEQYSKFEQAYMNGKTDIIVDDTKNTVYLRPYIMDLHRQFDYLHLYRLSKEKAYRNELNKTDMPVYIPKSVLLKLETDDSFFSTKNKVPGNNSFYASDDISYYVMRYDQQTDSLIKSGCLSVTYNLPLSSKKFITNISKIEVQETTMPVVTIKVGSSKYILFDRNYKNYSFTRFSEINILANPETRRFQIVD